MLKEARPVTPEIPRDMTDIQAKAAAFNIISEGNSIHLEERQLMGRFGALLLVGLCMPLQDTPAEIVGRILSILFNWFRITAYTFDSKLTYCSSRIIVRIELLYGILFLQLKKNILSRA